MFEIGQNIKRFRQKFCRNIDGHFAVTTALVGLPLLLLAGGSLDMNRAVSKKANISAALDTAVLASVIPDNLTDVERAAFAQDIFDQNYVGDVPVTLQIAATQGRVDITGTAHVPTLFSGVVGIDTLSVSDDSAAIVTQSDVVCVLALDPNGDRAIEFKEQAVFSAPGCSVQVNSTSKTALSSAVVSPPVAKSFCVSGISQGQYSPYVKHACAPIADPYENLTPPSDGWCISPQLVSGYLSSFSTGSDTEDTFGDNAVLTPGTYCKGLKIKGTNVTFLPGTYIIKGGKFEISQSAQVIGSDVTFVLKGKKASLEIKSDAQVNFKAPSTGTYAGLVFYQIPDDKKQKYPTGKSNIKSGGGLSITGTAYFPTQELNITSDSPVATYSPATSFIAYRLSFGGKSNTQVHVDHEAGGVPPLLPRSDDGARLVSTSKPSSDNNDITD